MDQSNRLESTHDASMGAERLQRKIVELISETRRNLDEIERGLEFRPDNPSALQDLEDIAYEAVGCVVATFGVVVAYIDLAPVLHSLAASSLSIAGMMDRMQFPRSSEWAQRTSGIRE